MEEKIKSLNDLLITNASAETIKIKDIISSSADIDEPIKEFKSVQDFLNDNFYGKKDTEMKKLFNLAKVATTPDEELKNSDVLKVASAVDEGLQQCKTAYQANIGLISPTKAVDMLIDHTAARVSAIAEKVVEQGIIRVSDAVANVVGAAFPPARVITPVIRTAGRLMAKPCAKFVVQGVKKVAQAAKSIAHAVISAVGSVFKGIFNFIFS